MHLLPGLLREHLPTVGREQGSQDLASVGLHGLDVAALQLGDPAAVCGALQGNFFPEEGYLRLEEGVLRF